MLSKHEQSHQIVYSNQRYGWESDGAPINGRQYTILSEVALSGLKTKDHHGTSCPDCLKVTEGWSFVFALENVKPSQNVRRHIVVEHQ